MTRAWETWLDMGAFQGFGETRTIAIAHPMRCDQVAALMKLGPDGAPGTPGTHTHRFFPFFLLSDFCSCALIVIVYASLRPPKPQRAGNVWTHEFPYAPKPSPPPGRPSPLPQFLTRHQAHSVLVPQHRPHPTPTPHTHTTAPASAPTALPRQPFTDCPSPVPFPASRAGAKGELPPQHASLRPAPMPRPTATLTSPPTSAPTRAPGHRPFHPVLLLALRRPTPPVLPLGLMTVCTPSFTVAAPPPPPCSTASHLGPPTALAQPVVAYQTRHRLRNPAAQRPSPQRRPPRTLASCRGLSPDHHRMER